MELGVDLIRISPDDWIAHPPPDPVPEYEREVWIYRSPQPHVAPVFILLAHQPDGAIRVGIAAMTGNPEGPGAAMICEQRLEPPCPPAHTPEGKPLPFGAFAALAWAVNWFDRLTAP